MAGDPIYDTTSTGFTVTPTGTTSEPTSTTTAYDNSYRTYTSYNYTVYEGESEKEIKQRLL
jgi:hypothetical protein